MTESELFGPGNASKDAISALFTKAAYDEMNAKAKIDFRPMKQES